MAAQHINHFVRFCQTASAYRMPQNQLVAEVVALRMKFK
jgi:hypothetical protein